MQRVKVYVATPYAALHCSDEIRAHLAKQIAIKECEKISLANLDPISPVLWLEGKFDEATQREEALQAGLALLKECDYFYESTHPAAAHSKGMRHEREFAMANDIPQIKINADGGVDVCLWM